MGYLVIIYFVNFFTLVLINFFTLFLTNLFLEQSLLLERRIGHFFWNTLLFSVLISSASLVDLINGRQVGFLIYSILLALQIFSGYLLIRSFYPMMNYAQNLFIQTISVAILAVFKYMLLTFSLSCIQHLPQLATMFVGISICVFQVGAATIVCYAARRSQIVTAIKRILEHPVFMLIFAGSFF